jgi:release factor glutamine methyltransferase
MKPLESKEQPWTIRRLVEWTTSYLADRGSESPLLDTQVLLAHALGCKRIDIYTRFEDLAPEEGRQRFKELIRKRIEGCPVAYLVGRKEFFSLELEVTPAVLIPRPDSESLVDDCLRLAKEMAAPTVLDIGTGSGNLVVAVARQHRGAKLTAIDISSEALAVASRNAATHDVADRIRFLQGDLFAPLAEAERFDFVLSNPPYIPHGDLATLARGVRDYEPHLALDGGPDGFNVFERLIDRARNHLVPGGYLIVEIGSPQEEPARKRILSTSGYELAPTIRDSSGHPRVLRARLR